MLGSMRSLVGGRLFKIDHLDRPVPCSNILILRLIWSLLFL
jgi:hypothetical protein